MKNPRSYVKFPRIRFILRPKYKKEYNPIDTYGKSDEALLYKKDKNLTYKKYFKEIQITPQKDRENYLEKENTIPMNNINKNIEEQQTKHFQNNNSPDKKEFSINQNEEEEEEEEEPEWANDNVEDYKNEEIIFKAIPEPVETKTKEDIINFSNSIKEKGKNEKDTIKINVDNFFADESNNDFKGIQNINKENDNILIEKANSLNSSKNKSIDSSVEDFMGDTKNKLNNLESYNNFESNIIKNNTNSNGYFDIFDTENKFKNIYLEDENSNENIFQSEEENNNNENSKKIKNKIQDDNFNGSLNIDDEQNNSEEYNLQKNQKYIQLKNYINNKNNLNNNLNTNNNNINIQQINLNNTKNFIPNNMSNMNEKYIYNIYNNNNFNLINFNNLSFHPFNNTNIPPNNYFPNIRGFNNPYLPMNNMINYNIPNNNISKNELFGIL